MKKNKLLIIASIMSMLLGGCNTDINSNNNEEKIELVDIQGMSLVEAIVALNGEVSLNPIYQETNQYLPERIISYGANLKVGDKVDKNMIIDVNISKKPANAVSYDSKIDYISEVSKLTGPNSKENKETLLNGGIYGTDLGIPVSVNDKMIFLFGDSFSGDKMKGLWNSNFIAISSDKDYYDGLTFDGLVTFDNGMVKPFAQGKHQNGNEFDTNVEVTKIPTGGITIGEYTYVFYMSIRYWGPSGCWNVNYNQCLKSKDLSTWKEVDGLRFTEEEAINFAQIYPMEDPNSDYIYLYGIEGGRNGGATLARVKKESFEDRSLYEYLVAKDTWEIGDSGLKKLKENAYWVVSAPVGEMSVCYNEYLKKYMTVFSRNGKLIMLTANTPYDTFTNPVTLLSQQDYSGIYGGFIHPNYLTDGGKSFYMTVSSWEVYNVYWVKVVLK